MTITYEYGGNLYINMTNQCPNACDFCLRQNSSGSLYADNLWYEGAEPSKEAMLADICTRDLKKYGEIVFCGYGEPACRWDDMLWLAAEIKAMGPYKLRINTNGLADCITGRSTAAEMRGLIDTVSVSLNAPNAEKYDAVCHSKYGPAAFDAMLRFTAEAVKNVPHVVMTVVSTMPAEDIEACRKICASVGAVFRVRAYISE